VEFNPDVRTQVARQLASKSAPGGPLHREAAGCTDRRYAADVHRAKVRKRIIERYLAQANPRIDGCSAIVTAGAPGAGKTSILEALVVDLAEYRRIDADEIKDYLIEQALNDGIYDDLLAEVLADGHSLAPRELAGLVHIESVKMADQIRQLCIERGENIVIEGTLTWEGQGPRIFRELADARYTDVEVYAVDTEKAVAHEQALTRWWERRQLWIRGEDPLGGRFTPADAIDVCYPSGAQSVCITHALRFIESAQTGEIPSLHVSVVRRQATGVVEISDERFYRQ